MFLLRRWRECAHNGLAASQRSLPKIGRIPFVDRRESEPKKAEPVDVTRPNDVWALSEKHSAEFVGLIVGCVPLGRGFPQFIRMLQLALGG